MGVEKSDEMVMALDDNSREIGLVSRRLANRVGIWHLCAQVFVLVREVEGSAYLLFQRRSRKKSVSPGVIDISASGHVTAEQDSLTAALSELKEELGIDVAEERLTFIGRRIDLYSSEKALSRIFADVFIVEITQAHLKEICTAPEEVEEVLLIKPESLMEMFSPDGQERLDGLRIEAGKEVSLEPCTVAAVEFLPRFDNLYYRIGRLAQEYSYGQGNKVLL